MGACLCKTRRRSLGSSRDTVEEGSIHGYHQHSVASSFNSSSPPTGTASPAAPVHQRIRAGGLLAGAMSFSSSHLNLSHYLSHKSSRNHAVPSSNNTGTNHNHNTNHANNRIWSFQNKLAMHADRLVIDTLNSIQPSALIEPSDVMQKLHMISETELGWLVVISSLINKVNLEHPFGSALILLILEDAPLPTKKSITQLDDMLALQMQKERSSAARKRNISIVLGCLAEKLAGTLSSVLFSQTVQDYLMSQIELHNEPCVILHSIIALEKFSQTNDNKFIITKRLNQLGFNNPLLKLEKLMESPDFIEQQVGFCSKWCLDNYFLYEHRSYTYETIDKDNLNVMLNCKDASENLKIFPDGLTTRNDTSRFESVRCTFAMTSGIYYYEVLLITSGVMQIGLATKQSKFLNHDGFGVGDDEQSYAYDGCRQLLWHNAKSTRTSLPRWKEGDIVGCLIDLNLNEVRFSLNGQMGEPGFELFKNKPLSTQYYAAASFMPFQQCVFNFGRIPFEHPPENHNFRTFNQCAVLSDEEKTIRPRHLVLKDIYSNDSMINTCAICCDNIATVILKPCDHNGFCKTCADLLDNCPMCRTTITMRLQLKN